MGREEKRGEKERRREEWSKYMLNAILRKVF